MSSTCTAIPPTPRTLRRGTPSRLSRDGCARWQRGAATRIASLASRVRTPTRSCPVSVGRGLPPPCLTLSTGFLPDSLRSLRARPAVPPRPTPFALFLLASEGDLVVSVLRRCAWRRPSHLYFVASMCTESTDAPSQDITRGSITGLRSRRPPRKRHTIALSSYPTLLRRNLNWSPRSRNCCPFCRSPYPSQMSPPTSAHASRSSLTPCSVK
ncbi:hypothetical protein C8Q79DRAFT_96848 [Trametes meyenii]|nr:hypothetical protein C8Q79DRAFT_96848 [Trametes meyenii]